MTLQFHRLVQNDVWEIMRYYEHESGTRLADEFYEEFMLRVHAVVMNPQGFHLVAGGLRRVNLRRFPHHFLFRFRNDRVLILVLRHDRRHPSFGLRREY